MDNIQHAEADICIMSCAASMVNAMSAIANMKIKEDTNLSEALALCIAIAKIEMEKCDKNL